MSEDIQVFSGLELHVRSMYIVRFFSTLQVNVTRLKTLLSTKVLDNYLTNVRSLSRCTRRTIRVPRICGRDGRNLVRANSFAWESL